MTKKIEKTNYEDAVSWLRDHGFDILEPPGTKNRVFLKKMNCAAAIEKNEEDGGVKIFAKPGYMIAGEISKLVDRGYQKFLKTSKTEVPATADHLKALHEFTAEVKESFGGRELYNEALGTVSDSYMYDRVEHRDEAENKRPKPAWENKKEAVTPLPKKKPA